MQIKWDKAFRELAGLAAGQLGLVTAAQAERVGVTAAGLRDLADRGLLWELDWSVFQITENLVAPRYAYPLAAWLALTPSLFRWERPGRAWEDAVLSHESASQLWGLGSLASPSVVFTAPPDWSVTAPRAVEIRSATLSADTVATHHDVPVTTPCRTLLDLVRGWKAHDEVRRALTDALRFDLVDLAVVYRTLLPLAAEHHFPADGPGFAGYFLVGLDTASISLRNQHAYANLVSNSGRQSP